MKKYVWQNDCDPISIRQKAIEWIKTMRKYLFPGFFEPVCEDLDLYLERLEHLLRSELTLMIEQVFKNEKDRDATLEVTTFFAQLPEVVEKITSDLEATFRGDPAAHDYREIILTYPGLFAISIHRIAHLLYLQKIPYLPRMLSEYAHSKTGIDIHPGAVIGHSFFIDHGTGIVIGETAQIGDRVRIYQGVTLGAISLGRGHALQGTKRHPTIGNDVIIYSNVTVLGGDTVIGDETILGSNIYVLESVPAHSVVRLREGEQEIIPRGERKAG